MIDEQIRKDLDNTYPCYSIGILADNEQHYPGVDGDESVGVMRNSNNVVFFIKPLSPQPKIITDEVNPYQQTNLYVGLDYQQNKKSLLPLGYTYNDTSQKIELLRDTLQNKLVIFKPRITFNKKDNKYYKNLDLFKIIQDVSGNESLNYIPIPKVNITNSSFEEKLIEESNIMFEDYNHMRNSPNYILCGNYIYCTNTDISPWQKHETNIRMWKCSDAANNISKVKINLLDRNIGINFFSHTVSPL